MKRSYFINSRVSELSRESRGFEVRVCSFIAPVNTGNFDALTDLPVYWNPNMSSKSLFLVLTTKLAKNQLLFFHF